MRIGHRETYQSDALKGLGTCTHLPILLIYLRRTEVVGI